MTRKLFGVILCLVVLASVAVYLITRPPSKGLELTGLVDADEVSVSSQITGRLQQVLVDEGNSVKEGQLLATIVPQELKADQAFYASSMKSANAQVGAARATLKFQELQTRDQIHQAEANLSVTEAELKQAQANLSLARQNFTRTEGLFKQQIVSQQQQDQAQTTLQTAQANVEALEKQVQAARAAVALARSNAEQVTIRERQLAANPHQFAAAQAQDQAAQARRRRRDAEADEREGGLREDRDRDTERQRDHDGPGRGRQHVLEHDAPSCCPERARRQHVITLGERQHLAAHQSRDGRPVHHRDCEDDDHLRVGQHRDVPSK